jgi:UDP-3-O-[3-hydroxymyristoyl] glucosamine N-acyltransferase
MAPESIGLNSEIGQNVRIARDVTIGTNVIINADTRIGAGSDIGDFAVVDADTVLPRNSVVAGAGGIVLQSNARRFQDGSVANRCETYRGGRCR